MWDMISLWGPRKVGKTTLLRRHFPQAASFDPLESTLRSDKDFPSLDPP